MNLSHKEFEQDALRQWLWNGTSASSSSQDGCNFASSREEVQGQILQDDMVLQRQPPWLTPLCLCPKHLETPCLGNIPVTPTTRERKFSPKFF